MNTLIQLPYATGKFLYAVVFSQDATRIWNGSVFEAADPTHYPAYAIPVSDSGHVGMYLGEFPEAIVTPGVYGVVFSQKATNVVTPDVSDPEVGVQSIEWSGAPDITIPFSSYSNVDSANSYFATRYHTEVWDAMSNDDKQATLNDATRFIDRFGYIGCRTAVDQLHEFPRTGIRNQDSTLVPNDIYQAQYEIALALANGYDPEREMSGLRVTSRGYSSVRTTYDTRLVSEWQLLGFPSQAAWAYLSPYLNRDSAGTIIIHRAT